MPKGKDGDDRAGPVVGAPQHPLPRGIVEVPFLLSVDRTVPAHEMVQAIVGQRSRDAIAYLGRHVAPTVIRSTVVHRAFA